MGDSTIWVIKGDTRSLDYGSYRRLSSQSNDPFTVLALVEDAHLRMVLIVEYTPNSGFRV